MVNAAYDRLSALGIRILGAVIAGAGGVRGEYYASRYDTASRA